MITFGNRIELMVDEYLIDKKDNISFRLNPPKDMGKVIGFDEPWEGLGSVPVTVLDDGNQVKFYYRGFPTGGSDFDPKQTACLAVSDDGLHFTRYPVYEIEYDGFLANNIVMMHPDFCHNFAAFYDTNPLCKPEERYKAIGGHIPENGIRAFGSPDGIHWHELSDKPVITRGVFDSMNIAFWNPATGLYHCYSRYWYSPDRNFEDDDKNYTGIRAIQNCVSSDFIHWENPKENQYAEGHPTDELYTNATSPIPGAEHILISTPMRFHPTRTMSTFQSQSKNNSGEGISDAILMTSRDGVFWDRTIRDAFLSGGPANNEWSQRNFITAGGVICRGDQFIFYAGKNYMQVNDGIWAFAVPKYRLISAYADGKGGSFTTKPMQFVSNEIHLNFSTSGYGYLKLSIFNDDGTLFWQSDEIFGNALSHAVCIDGLTGRTGIMRIELSEAHLYAIGSKM